MPNERMVMNDYLAGWQIEKKPMRPGGRSRSLRSTSPGTPICESGSDILLYWEVKRLQIAKSVFLTCTQPVKVNELWMFLSDNVLHRLIVVFLLSFLWSLVNERKQLPSLRIARRGPTYFKSVYTNVQPTGQRNISQCLF